MLKLDAHEIEVLTAFEQGRLKSVATKAEFAKFKAAARATLVNAARKPSAVKRATSDN